MYLIKHILRLNHYVKWQERPLERIRIGSLSLSSIVVKELRYLLLDKGVYTRDYSNGALYKLRGIWWLGRNRFIRFVASVA